MIIKLLCFFNIYINREIKLKIKYSFNQLNI